MSKTLMPMITLWFAIGAWGQTTAPGDPAEQAKLVSPDAKLEKLATGLTFTEGPTWSNDDGGFLVFSDMNKARLMRWDARAGLTQFRDGANNPNGNTRDLEGRLLTCEHTSRRVMITQRDGTVQILVDQFEGKKFNSPNDVVVKSDGTIWFTDPPFGLPRDQKRELDKNFVFRLDPKTNKLTIVSDAVQGPNGLAFSPDEKRLYIADNGGPKNIRIFDVQDDGTLKGAGILGKVDRGTPDGIRCDEQGNLWSTQTGGLIIWAPDGKLIGRIPVPEVPANICFGGEDGKTLFITARTSLYSIRINVRGANRKAG